MPSKSDQRGPFGNEVRQVEDGHNKDGTPGSQGAVLDQRQDPGKQEEGDVVASEYGCHEWPDLLHDQPAPVHYRTKDKRNNKTTTREQRLH